MFTIFLKSMTFSLATILFLSFQNATAKISIEEFKFTPEDSLCLREEPKSKAGFWKFCDCRQSQNPEFLKAVKAAASQYKDQGVDEKYAQKLAGYSSESGQCLFHKEVRSFQGMVFVVGSFQYRSEPKLDGDINYVNQVITENKKRSSICGTGNNPKLLTLEILFGDGDTLESIPLDLSIDAKENNGLKEGVITYAVVRQTHLERIKRKVQFNEKGQLVSWAGRKKIFEISMMNQYLEAPMVNGCTAQRSMQDEKVDLPLN